MSKHIIYIEENSDGKFVAYLMGASRRTESDYTDKDAAIQQVIARARELGLAGESTEFEIRKISYD